MTSEPSGPETAVHRFAVWISVAAFAALIAGGLVTSTGSGLAVPDWPLSFGKFFPPMPGGVLFEHGHRMIAGATGLLTLALSIWVWRRENSPGVRRLAAAAAGGILLQAVLGGITVLRRLPAPVSIAHACLGPTVFCLILAVSETTSSRYRGTSSIQAGPLWKWGAAGVAAVYIQMLLGAILRHTGRALLFHMLWASAAAATLIAAAVKGLARRSSAPFLFLPSAAVAPLLLAQLMLGFMSFIVRHSSVPFSFPQEVALTTAHMAAGALLLGVAVVWTLRAHRLR